jgi:hypothetical protein
MLLEFVRWVAWDGPPTNTDGNSKFEMPDLHFICTTHVELVVFLTPCYAAIFTNSGAEALRAAASSVVTRLP